MQIHDVKQGTPEWHELRAKYFTASEAPAMMGVSKFQSRDQLLHEKSTGEREPVNPYKQKIFAQGHAAEAKARPIIESIIGEDLFPTTISDTVEELPLLASFDGMTMGQETLFEHKLWNEKLAAAVVAGDIPEQYLIQMEQQLILSGAQRVIFVVSDGTEQNMERFEYKPDMERRARIMAGWKQFSEDLQNYKPGESAPQPEATAITELPALRVDIVGKVNDTNLAIYEETASDFIQKINTDLQTDQDFVDADKAAKFCREAAKKLELVKQQALSQTADIDAIFKSIDKMAADFNSKGLELEKLVKAEKDNRKREIIADGQAQLDEFIAEQNKAFNRPYLNYQADFKTATKSKRTLDSLKSAVNTELANAKIAVSEQAAKVAINVKTLQELANDYKFLFADLDQIIFKDSEDFTLLVKSRISIHQEAEKAKNEKAIQAGQAQQQAAEQREAATTTQPVQDAATPRKATEAPFYLNFQKGEDMEFFIKGETVVAYTIHSDYEQDGQMNTIENFITVKGSAEMRDYILEHLKTLELK